MTCVAAKVDLRNRLWKLQEGKCHLCGKIMLRESYGPPNNHGLLATFDHIVPRSMGGSNRQSNIKLAHRKCNCERGNGNAP